MTIIIDAHVHIYPEFSIDCFFEAGFRNFSKIGAGKGLSETSDYVLFLTEGGEHNVFGDLCKRAESDALKAGGGLCFLKTEESETIIVKKNSQCIYVFSGRQYVSNENVELLALFSKQHIEDKSLSLADLCQAVVNDGGIAVLPWGVGKWLGKRGAVVKNLIDSSCDIPIFLGDNGNRPLFWPTPSLLRYARKKQIPILSGSDPLPLLSHCNRVASSGTILLHGELSKVKPAASLRKQLNCIQDSIEFGSRMKGIRFLCDQLQLII